ncbi:aminoglycoside phosphotransferase family protein [Chitinophaga sedimenti]|uniref:phosphotransferase enzyme family protein n=1 Tax=Chitinophaga sedimenti TaxID=2033606 RepID=UPI00200498EE|nr:phosphotransferase [Chitinophaga sedimenti]MCK7560168.1 aminoglycoside phosphotransferase family protein [Chitinophaga sedimenti]
MVNIVIIKAFGLDAADFEMQRFGSGHINNTFLLSGKNGEKYVLQKINTNVFKEPWVIARNQRLAADYLAQKAPDYLFITPIKTTAGEELFVFEDEYWRLIPFIAGSMSVDQADNPKQAYEAAKEFGKMARLLAGIDMSGFKATIPNFHNLTLRYSAFQDAIRTASEERKRFSEALVEAFLGYSDIAVTFEKLKTSSDFGDRVMHHDTKINNVLLQQGTFEGLCVCDRIRSCPVS